MEGQEVDEQHRVALVAPLAAGQVSDFSRWRNSCFGSLLSRVLMQENFGPAFLKARAFSLHCLAYLLLYPALPVSLKASGPLSDAQVAAALWYVGCLALWLYAEHLERLQK